MASTIQTYSEPLPTDNEVDIEEKTRFEIDAEIGAAGESKIVVEEVRET